MGKLADEWLSQAEYDLETAEYMYAGGRYFYAVFMAHLAVEKSLKGMYQQLFDKIPPKTHNLIYLAERTSLEPPPPLRDFILTLNDVSVPTRYPEELDKLASLYNQARTREILNHASSLITWIKSQL